MEDLESNEKPTEVTKESSTGVPFNVAGLKRQRNNSLRAASSSLLKPEDFMMVIFVTFPSIPIKTSKLTVPSSSSVRDAVG